MTLEIVRYLSAAVGTVLLVAAAAKLADGEAFAGFLARAGLSAAAVAPLAVAVPWLEALVGVALLTGLLLTVVAVVAAVLATAFVAVQLREIARHGLRGGCRCFGALDSAEPSVIPLIRAATVLAGAAALAVLVSFTAHPVGAFSGDDGAAATLVGVLSGAAVVAAFTVAAETIAFERRRAEQGVTS